MSGLHIIGGRDRINYALNPSFELFNSAVGDSPIGWSVGSSFLKSIPVDSTFILNQSINFPRAGTTVLGASNLALATQGTSITLYDLPKLTLMYVTVNVLIREGVDNATIYINGQTSGSDNTPARLLAEEFHTLSANCFSSLTGTLEITLTLNEDTSGEGLNGFFDCLYVGDSRGSYFDGDSPGAKWLGIPHASASFLPASAPYSGKTLDLKGVLDEEIGLSLHTISGFGDSELEHKTTDNALGEISIIKSVPKPRTMTIAATVKASTRAHYHTRRAQLLELLRPRSNSEVRIFRYTNDDGLVMDIPAWYKSGLSSPRHGQQYFERLALQFVSPDPNPYMPEAIATAIDVEKVQAVEYVAQLALDYKGATTPGLTTYNRTGLPGPADYMVMTPDGLTVAVVNDMLGGGGTAQSRIYIDNGAANTWRHMATANSFIYTVRLGAYNRVFFGGAFTSLSINSPGGFGANAFSRMMSTFLNISSVYFQNNADFPANSTVRDIHIADNQIIYAVGDFTTLCGIAINKVGKISINGAGTATASKVDPLNTLPNNSVYAVTVINNDVFIGGAFTTFGPANSSYLAKFDYDTQVWKAAAVAGSVPAAIKILVAGKQGRYYASSRGAGSPFLMVGDGTNLTALVTFFGANYLNDMIYSTRLDTLFIAGSAATITHDGYVVKGDDLYTYKDEVLAAYPMRDVASTAIKSLAFMHNLLAVGYTVINPTLRGPVYKIVQIDGNADTQPYFCFSGKGILRRIDNITTGVSISLNYYLTPGEVLTVDTRQLSRGVRSSILGDVSYAIDPSSDLAGFCLLPSDYFPNFTGDRKTYNLIRIWVERRPNDIALPTDASYCTMYYHPTFSSFDAASAGQRSLYIP